MILATSSVSSNLFHSFNSVPYALRTLRDFFIMALGVRKSSVCPQI
jgi:hypothetical protein